MMKNIHNDLSALETDVFAQRYALVVVHATIGLACCHHLMAVVAWWHNLYGTRLVA